MRLRILFALVLVLVASPIAIILIDGLNDNVRPSDVGIVFGSKVMPDGTPSPRLAARLDRVAELYRQGMFERVIVSGGMGPEGFNEAIRMRDYLVAKHVPSAAILVDENGDNTWATAQNSARLMKRSGFSSALIVTQYFHITRSRCALQAQGIKKIYTAHPKFVELRDFYSIGREAVACLVYCLLSYSHGPPHKE